MNQAEYGGAINRLIAAAQLLVSGASEEQRLDALGVLAFFRLRRARIAEQGVPEISNEKEPVRFLVCRGHETITEITSNDRNNSDQEEQEPEGAEAVPR